MFQIPKSIAYEMVVHSRAEAPKECCGILAGLDGSVRRNYRITNTAHSPYRYLMDPQEQLRAMLNAERNGWEVLAFYHSHTHTKAYPSRVDVGMALESGYHSEYYVLVSLEDPEQPQVRVFEINEAGEVGEREYELT